MPLARTMVRLGSTACLAAGLALPARAERIVVPPGTADLQAILDRASEGDVIALQAGEHRGPVRVTRKLSLEGEPGAVLAGANLENLDSGIFVEKTATGALVEGNRIEGYLYGIYLHGAENAIARKNEIVGLREGRVNDAGNGISVWNATGAKVLDNDLRFGRDGIFAITSRRNVFSGNRFRDLRFAVHYMYTNDSEVSNNVSIGNTVGFAIMFSNRLVIRGNVSDGDRDHGFMFNYANGSQIAGNTVRGRLKLSDRWITGGLRPTEAREHGLSTAADQAASRPVGPSQIGPEKCVFIYNANQNRFRDNWFEGCEIGVHFTAGSEGNEIVGNAFLQNRNQVKYVGTRHLDWSKGGRGNYWSDNPAFDLNGDGIGDTAYRPNDLVDKVLWTAPQAKVLVNSPAVQVIRWRRPSSRPFCRVASSIPAPSFRHP